MDYTSFLNQRDRLSKLPISEFIQNGGIADKFMDKNHSKIKIYQLRNFFSEINRLKPEEFNINDRAMLEMNLAYDFGRNVITFEFHDLLTKSLAKITKEDRKADFEAFKNMVKALIAYHKYYSQKNS